MFQQHKRKAGNQELQVQFKQNHQFMWLLVIKNLPTVIPPARQRVARVTMLKHTALEGPSPMGWLLLRAQAQHVKITLTKSSRQEQGPMGYTDRCLQAVYAEHERSRLLGFKRTRHVLDSVLLSYPKPKSLHHMYMQQPQLPANQYTQRMFRKGNSSLGWRRRVCLPTISTGREIWRMKMKH